MHLIQPDGSRRRCSAAVVSRVCIQSSQMALFAVQIGDIKGVHRGTFFGLASLPMDLKDIAGIVVRADWLRRFFRKGMRKGNLRAGVGPAGSAAALAFRANISLGRLQDTKLAVASISEHHPGQGRLVGHASRLNIVDLFAGAGGLGLGFLLGGQKKSAYRIVFSGEANPIFAQTLRANHHAFERLAGIAPAVATPAAVAAVDLRERKTLDVVAAGVKDAGGAHFVVGGPPCQGFSMANRNSWSANNPNNALVDVYVNYVMRLKPLGFLMENVQGILWTPDAGTTISVVDVIEKRLSAAGYVLFPKLLDSAWYGVPQNRTRLFMLGLHRDLGYSAADFGAWGPFPKPQFGGADRPFVTVREAIADLPRIGNGHALEATPYEPPSRGQMRENEFLQFVRQGAEPGVVFDHVTSRHAEYVIERYRRIPPGGNWESIRDDLTNYSSVDRTHSNIYRRLKWDEPSVTIGHYRKSMLVHPSQHRGLSLREASRLQSFPDWFRFSGTVDGRGGGLMHKQQQLANAVSPLVAKAIAEFILTL